METIKVKTSRVRDYPRSYAPSIAEVREGDEVCVLEQKGGWLLVKTGDCKTGWLHRGAIAERPIIPPGGTRVLPEDCTPEEAVAGTDA